MKITSLRSLLELYKSSKLSFEEALSFYYSQIERFENTYNALITIVEKEKVFQTAKKLQKEYEKLLKSGFSADQIYKKYPLLGVPVIHKDMFLTKGIRTTAASRVLDDFIPPFSATVVRRLEEAGAYVIAKANQDAWAHGSSGENSDYGPTRNPWNKEYVPGGSSSGSAVATLLLYAPIVTGTDTGGSIRQPASFCGVVGLKPTYGRVSRYGIVAMASSLDSIGHFTTTVWDNAYVLSITAGKDPYDATTSSAPTMAYHLAVEEAEKSKLQLRGFKVGILKEFYDKGVDDKIKQVTLEAIKRLEKLGATLLEVSIPEVKYGLEIYYIIQPAEVASNLARYDGIRYGNDRSYFGKEAKRRIMLGNFILSDVVVGKPESTSYTQAVKAKALLVARFKQIFKEVDVLAGPVSPVLPFKLGERTDDPLKMYMADLLTVPVNIAGLPALSVNVGWIEGFPVGLQIIGPYFGEALIYKIGALIHEFRYPLD